MSYLEGDVPDADRSGSEQEGDLEDEDEQKIGRAAVMARLGLLRHQEQNPQQQDRAQLQYIDKLRSVLSSGRLTWIGE